MRHIIRLLVGGLLLLTSAACGTKPLPPSDDLDGFIQYQDEMIPKLQWGYRVPGTAVALVHNGEPKGVVWAQGYGLADKASGAPVAADTVFQVASISKSVTTWAVLRLVEQGKLDLNALGFLSVVCHANPGV